jgi:hypothetical protein
MRLRNTTRACVERPPRLPLQPSTDFFVTTTSFASLGIKHSTSFPFLKMAEKAM